jgi:hypothetical protein
MKAAKTIGRVLMCVAMIYGGANLLLLAAAMVIGPSPR